MHSLSCTTAALAERVLKLAHMHLHLRARARARVHMQMQMRVRMPQSPQRHGRNIVYTHARPPTTLHAPIQNTEPDEIRWRSAEGRARARMRARARAHRHVRARTCRRAPPSFSGPSLLTVWAVHGNRAGRARGLGTPQPQQPWRDAACGRGPPPPPYADYLQLNIPGGRAPSPYQ